MLKKGKIIITFVILLGILSLLVSYIILPKDKEDYVTIRNYNAMQIVYENKDSIDCLFIGDSLVYSSISPMEIWHQKGYTSYDLSTSAQSLSVSLSLLQETLEFQKPKVVFLETSTFYRNISDSILIVDQIGEYIPFVKYHDRWKDMLIHEKNYGHNEKKGYRENFQKVKAKDTTSNKITKKIKKVSDNSLYYIQKIDEICNENDIQLVFISNPSLESWSYKKHNGIEQIAKQLEIPYLDLNLEPIGIDWNEDSKDGGDHVNYYGSMKVTKYIADYLDQFGLNSHKDEKVYDIWNQDYERYKKMIETNFE